MKLFIYIVLVTAARIGVILDLKLSQVDFEKKLIDFGLGWGNKRRAVVPINDNFYECLKNAKELAQTDYVIEYHSKHVAFVKSGFLRICKGCGILHQLHRQREQDRF